MKTKHQAGRTASAKPGSSVHSQGSPARTTSWKTATCWAVLAGLLLILCIRLTTNEPIEDGAFSGYGAAVGTLTAGVYSSPGVREVLTLAVCTFCLAVAGFAAAEKMAREKLWRLAGIFLLAGWCTLSAFHASNKFGAIAGVFDLAMGMIGGWAVAVVCNTDRRRQFAISILVALLAVICAKGFYEKYFELPATLHYFLHHKQAFFRQMGWGPGNPNILLFQSRVEAQAVTGFLNLSDGVAEVLLPISLICLPLALFLFPWRKMLERLAGNAAPSQPKESTGPTGRNQEIPAAIVPGVPLLVLFVLSLAVLVFTRSKGGMASEGICIVTLGVGWACRGFLERRRWSAVAAVVVVLLVLAGGMIGWGMVRHGLPTKDLLYRWQYWTGAARMVERHPMLGVGLNNFGYYYTHYKLPSSPEDVKDPHNPLVRLASEAGLPAAAIWGILVLAAFLLVVGKPAAEPTDAASRRTIHPVLLAAFALAWWIIQMAITAPAKEGPGEATFLMLMAGSYAAIGFLGMVLANGAWAYLSGEQKRVVLLALALGAAGMCLYDQISLALVTGPVAMLFWISLGTAQSVAAESADETGHTGALSLYAPARGALRHGLFALVTLAAAVGIVFIWLPAQTGRLAMDPQPWQQAYRRAAENHDNRAALVAVDHVLACKPRSQGWLARKIELTIAAGHNPRKEVLKLLSINRTNPRVRIGYAMTARSGLTLPERIAQLKLALQLNSDLPKKEITRLSPREVKHIREEIAVLESQKSATQP